MLWTQLPAETGLGRRTFSNLRAAGRGPVAFWLSPGRLAVWRSDLDAWLQSRPRTVRPELPRGPRHTKKPADRDDGLSAGNGHLTTTTTSDPSDSKRTELKGVCGR